MPDKLKSKRSLGANTLLYPLPVLLIGTYDAEGKANVMTAAWGGICCSNPISLCVSVRPNRYTHASLLANQAFTVGIATEALVAEADYFGIVSGKKENKILNASLTAVKAEKVNAPYIAQCPVIIECKLSKHFNLGVHTQIIGEIIDVKADEECLDVTEKFPDILKLKPLVYDSGSRTYYGLGKQVAKAYSVGKKFLK